LIETKFINFKCFGTFSWRVCHTKEWVARHALHSVPVPAENLPQSSSGFPGLIPEEKSGEKIQNNVF